MSQQLDIAEIRKDFPILERTVDGRPLIYLDNAATSQTPEIVVNAIDDMYHSTKANVHRGVHTLSQEATDHQEETREKVRDFINAESTKEIIFTRGTTEAINLVASSYGDMLSNGDEIILTVMEHHEGEVERHGRISELTNGYNAPVDASDEYKKAVDGLREFAADLHEHIHIENDVIFPKSEMIEQEIVLG